MKDSTSANRMARRRSDPKVARLVGDSIFETASDDAKQSYCKFVGASIAYLARHHPDRWDITLLEDNGVVRLNAGWVESLVLHPGGVRVLVDREMAPRRTNFEGRHYRNAPGCEIVAIRLSDLPRSLPKLTESHHKALSIAASQRPPHRGILAGHSTGITKWLSQVLPVKCQTRRLLHARCTSFKVASRMATSRFLNG